MKDGFIKVAAATNEVFVADVSTNLEKIKAIIADAAREGSKILVFPELCLCGYSCRDIFFQESLLEACEKALEDLIKYSSAYDMLIAVVALNQRN